MTSFLFSYQEPKWYLWGVKAGLLNLVTNRTALGLKKTFGKILQPLNNYTRFPEYHFFGQVVEQFISQNESKTLKILDIGSPKLFGLYLAYHYQAEFYLTDISRLNLDEFIIMWNAIKAKAKGQIIFDQQDGRNLPYSDSQFDIVYSMSVVEHIGGEGQDTKAATEMWRILKPNGQLVISIPFGQVYIEQAAVGFSHTVETSRDNKLYFFQRIYNQPVVQDRLMTSFCSAHDMQIWTVFRRKSWLTPLYHRLRKMMGESLNGLLGFTNPIVSLFLNCHRNGIFADFVTSYGTIHSLSDIYGDLIVACRKPYLSHK